MTSIRRANRLSWVLAAGIVAFVVLLGLPVYLNYQRAASEHRIVTCVADWANAYAARADRILKLSGAKNGALDDVIRAVASKSPAQFNSALRKYLAASDAYNDAQAASPLPSAPKFLCEHRSELHAASVVTRTVPAPGPTRTVGATRTVAAPRVTATVSSSPRPGAVVTATRTISVPGPTRTETFIPAAETVTRTVTAHPSPCVLIICLGGNP